MGILKKLEAVRILDPDIQSDLDAIRALRTQVLTNDAQLALGMIDEDEHMRCLIDAYKALERMEDRYGLRQSFEEYGSSCDA